MATKARGSRRAQGEGAGGRAGHGLRGHQRKPRHSRLEATELSVWTQTPPSHACPEAQDGLGPLWLPGAILSSTLLQSVKTITAVSLFPEPLSVTPA